MIHYLGKNLSEVGLCPQKPVLHRSERSSPVTPLHPFLVHLALSLALLTGTSEFFPRLRDRFPEKGWRLTENGALLLLLLAVLTGWHSLDTLALQNVTLPRQSFLHRLLAIFGTTTYGLLWLSARRRVPAIPSGSRRMIALAGLLLVLSAAAVGGHLVYEDRLGTDFMRTAPPTAFPLP